MRSVTSNSCAVTDTGCRELTDGNCLRAMPDRRGLFCERVLRHLPHSQPPPASLLSWFLMKILQTNYNWNSIIFCLVFVLPPHCNNSIAMLQQQPTSNNFYNECYWAGLLVNTYIGNKNKSLHSYNVTFVGVTYTYKWKSWAFVVVRSY